MRIKDSPVSQKSTHFWFLRVLLFLAAASLFGAADHAQDRQPGWQAEVRKLAEAHEWEPAMKIVDREVARAPQDMDVRAWRARVLA